jgi:glycine hydroxymethyltransferase
MGEKEMAQIAAFIVEALSNIDNQAKLAAVHEGVVALSKGFPLYKHRLMA